MPGGLCNAMLEQKELLQSGLQEEVNWVHSSDYRPELMLDKFVTIEARRDRLLRELPVKTTQAALKRIPLSAEYLFDKEKL